MKYKLIKKGVSVIAGGGNNIIRGVYNAILGGNANVVTGTCSAILGGANNHVTHNYAAAFGNGINSVANDTFHVSCLNARNTPMWPGSGFLPPGTVYYQTGVPLPAPWNTCRFLFIQP